MLSLSILAFGGNRLSGRLPLSLYNVSSIITISLTDNQLDGSLLHDTCLTLPNLRQIGISGNNFSGFIPLSFSNASHLEQIDIAKNHFEGEVPSDLGQLNLKWFNIGNNRFGNGKMGGLSFLTALSNCTGLELLHIGENHFEGVLPNSFSNLSAKIKFLNIKVNRISGSIPSGIANLLSLNTLVLRANLFTGIIPTSFGKLQNLRRLRLEHNRLTGEIPSSFRNMSSLSDLFLANNSLEGSIPPSLGNCTNLQNLYLSMNNLNGSIPKQVLGLLNQPFYMNLSNNYLTGSLPAEFGNLRNLQYFDVSHNKLSGENTKFFRKLLEIGTAILGRQFLEWRDSLIFGESKCSSEFSLSNNNFSGKIPTYLESLPSLQRLKLSFNEFEAQVPIKGVFQNASAFSLVGNTKLCGSISQLQLPACPAKVSKKQKKPPNRILIVIISVVILFIVLLMCSLVYCWIRKPMSKLTSTPSVGDQLFMVSYTDLIRATNEFSLMNLIGSGSFAHIYKGTLNQYALAVAVKVFNPHKKGFSKSFLAECEALRNIRHRNLVKTLTVCSSVDYEGNDFKALVFEFMPNESLEKWLHPDADGGRSLFGNLDLGQRINVALDVASTLNYLHHQCHIQIVHCDLKPSNVLLDNEMTAHIGDFGLAKLLSETTKDFSSIGIKGSIGCSSRMINDILRTLEYIKIAEYGMGSKASTQGDAYSYGILLLEMFLGKKPTDGMFKDGLNLHKFTREALPERVPERVYPTLAGEEIHPEENRNNMASSSSNRDYIQECQVSLIRIGVACSAERPGERMSMDDVTRELGLIRCTFLALMERANPTINEVLNLSLNICLNYSG